MANHAGREAVGWTGKTVKQHQQQQSFNHLLCAVESVVKAEEMDRKLGKVHEDSPLNVSLMEKTLWRQFHSFTNEMIVTKGGRRMFPVVKVTVNGLDPSAMYCLILEFVQLDVHRWKYMNGEWVPGGKAEARPPQSDTIYIHPDSPNFGVHWMKETVSFEKIKLTNKPSGEGQIILNSLHKYEPRVHVVKVESTIEKWRGQSFPFSETQFIAVTAYQNEEVTALKIRNNPFAKAFLDAKERSDPILDSREFTDLSEFASSMGTSTQTQYGSWYHIPSDRVCPPAPIPPNAHYPASNFNPHCERSLHSNRNQRKHAPYFQPNNNFRRQPTTQDYSFGVPSTSSSTQTIYYGNPNSPDTPWDCSSNMVYPSSLTTCTVTSSSHSMQQQQNPTWSAGNEIGSLNYNQAARGSPNVQQTYEDPRESVEILNYDSPGSCSHQSGDWSPLTPSPI